MYAQNETAKRSQVQGNTGLNLDTTSQYHPMGSIVHPTLTGMPQLLPKTSLFPSSSNSFTHHSHTPMQTNQNEIEASGSAAATTSNDISMTPKEEDEKRKEIYCYEAPYCLFASSWSCATDPQRKYRLAVSSFIEEYSNKISIVQLDEDNGALVMRSTFDHPYPATNIQWIPDTKGTYPDLIATSGDYLRLWRDIHCPHLSKVMSKYTKITAWRSLQQELQAFGREIDVFIAEDPDSSNPLDYAQMIAEGKDKLAQLEPISKAIPEKAQDLREDPMSWAEFEKSERTDFEEILMELYVEIEEKLKNRNKQLLKKHEERAGHRSRLPSTRSDTDRRLEATPFPAQGFGRARGNSASGGSIRTLQFEPADSAEGQTATNANLPAAEIRSRTANGGTMTIHTDMKNHSNSDNLYDMQVREGILEAIHQSRTDSESMIVTLATQMELNRQQAAVQFQQLLAANVEAMQRTSVRSNNGIMFPRLKDLAPSSFSGERPYEYWDFIEEFENTVGRRHDIPDSVKFQYLKDCLRKQAKEILDGMPIRDDSYEIALRELKKKYGDWGRVEDSALDRLERLAETDCEMNSTALEKVYYDQKKILRCLGEKAELGKTHIRMIKAAYPWDLMDRVIMKATEFKERKKREWSVDELMEGIRQAIAIVEEKERGQLRQKTCKQEGDGFHINYVQPTAGQEYVRQGSNQTPWKQTSGFKPSGGYQKGYYKQYHGLTGGNAEPLGQPVRIPFPGRQRPPPPCAACKDPNHTVLSCRRFPTAEAREAAISKTCCRKCFSERHSATDCRRFSCQKCGGAHNLAICPHMNEEFARRQALQQQASSNQIGADNQAKIEALLSANRTTEYCAPLTNFDWNEIEMNWIVTCSIDTTCSVWQLETNQVIGSTKGSLNGSVKTQLIAHDKEVFDVKFSKNNKNVFASVGADGSCRLFDLRDLAMSTIVYEEESERSLLRIGWNRLDNNYLATFAAGSKEVVILDMRLPCLPVARLSNHGASINGFSWAPHSANHICTAGDDSQALIWDVHDMPGPVDDPILAYKAGGEVNQIHWSSSFHDWISICYNNKVEILRV